MINQSIAPRDHDLSACYPFKSRGRRVYYQPGRPVTRLPLVLGLQGHLQRHRDSLVHVRHEQRERHELNPGY